MSTQYLVAIKQQLREFVATTNVIEYPYIVASSNSICNTRESLLDLINSLNPSNAVLIAMNVLPIYNVLPDVIINELISLLTPADRIELSHCCNHFRSLIISPRGLSDLWLYIYHIPAAQTTVQTPNKSSTKSTFMPYMIFNTNHTMSPTSPNHGPSHATSLPNTLATSAALSSQPSLSLFKTSTSTSYSTTPPKQSTIDEHDRFNFDNLAINNLKYTESRYKDEIHDNDNDDERKHQYTELPCDDDASATDSLCHHMNDALSDSISSTSPLLEHPSNPILTSKIIYWPNYKQVLACDFPQHWKRKNSFYKNLCVLSKNCGGAHIRVFEIGSERLVQILSRISPMLLSLCFLNTHQVNLNSVAFKRMNRLSYLAYQYIDGVAECFVYIPQNIVALEFTSSSLNNLSVFSTPSLYMTNIKFLQICNCRFSDFSFQRLLNLCPNIVHLSVTTSSWDGTISLPSSLLSIIWKHNDGNFTISECNKVWEVALTIYDSEMIQQLQPVHSLKQLVIATPLFKGMDFLDEMEKPFLFNTHQTTPFYNARSPSARSISHISLSPSLPTLSNRLNHHSFSRFDFDSAANNSGTESICHSVSTISLDSDDEDQSDNDNDILRIVCWQELVQHDWFKNKFTGDRVVFYDQRIINPIIQSEFEKLNTVFVQEMKQTTHMFLIAFPFF